jgi:hypothetical protein
MDSSRRQGGQMEVSAHEKIELHDTIVPEMRASGLINLIVPGVENEGDIYIDLLRDGTPRFVKATHAPAVENLISDSSRQGILRIDYFYRDPNDFRNLGVAEFSGLLTNFRACVIFTALIMEDGERFSPKNLGLKPLKGRWWSNDHPPLGFRPHELGSISFCPEENVETEADQIENLFNKCLTAISIKYPLWGARSLQ